MANSQSSERPDLQDLVAYMQGRGSETMRAQVLQRLDEDEEYLELMMDLVPMLREAGELADPDATADPATRAPATQPMAPQTVVDAPALPEPQRHAGEVPVLPGKVVALPRRTSRPYGVFAALAAMIPIAVAVWMTTRPQSSEAARIATRMAPISAEKIEDGMWGGGSLRGGNEPGCNTSDSACFDAGAQMVDLQLALRQGYEQLIRVRLANLATSLGADYETYFPGLAEVSKEGRFDLEKVKKLVRSGDRKLRKDQDRMVGFEDGVCLRAALLAARGEDAQFFADRRNRKQCLEIVGEDNWKPDSEALADRYFEVRTGNPNLP